MLTHAIRGTVLLTTVSVVLSWAPLVVADASGMVSDDYNQCSLNTSLWTVIDPIGDATVSVTGFNTADARLAISLPANSAHDMETSGSNDVRVTQPVNNTDFEIQVKLESVFDAGYQMYGIMVEQDDGVLLRYMLVSEPPIVFLYSATLEGGVIAPRGQLTVTNNVPYWLGVTRVGNDWTLRYSSDGTTWLDLTTFTFAINVTRAGPCAGNLGLNELTPAPAFTALFDYFVNNAEPLAAEDAPFAGYELTTATIGNGSIAIDPDLDPYYCGETVTLTAVADAGWAFAGWSGDATGDTNPIQVVMSQARSVTAEFTLIPVYGSIQVTILPPEAIAAGAQWNVDGGAWQNNDAIVGSLSVGDHTVSFKDVAGWNKPADQTVNVVANQTTAANGTYTVIPPSTGSLQITILPAEAVAAGAQWAVDGGAWQDSDAVVAGLAVGVHTVSFKDVAGWTQPGDQTVNVVANQTTLDDGTYTVIPPPTGSLQVTILPADAFAAGAQWAVDGGAWQDGGAVVGGLSVGDHTVSFKDVAGWTKPGDQAVNVAANQTTVANGTYVVIPTPTGSLQVDILPPDAVAAGAQWAVDGGAWRNSGMVVAGLSVGDHTVSFKDVTGWDKPGNQTVIVSANQTTAANGTYTAVPDPKPGDPADPDPKTPSTPTAPPPLCGAGMVESIAFSMFGLLLAGLMRRRD